MTDWVITIPQTIKWMDYMEEVYAVERGDLVMNYRLPHKPKAQVGDRCFVVWFGRIRGWMRIVGVVNRDGFTCETTGAVWPAGWYIQRAGVWHPIDNQPEMKGFRGIRRYCDNQHNA